MTDFWKLDSGEEVEASTTYESGGGNFEPIPNDTNCIAAIEEAKWDEYKMDRYISIKWRVLKPSQFEKRVLFQKVKVRGTSHDRDREATATKAKKMLAAIDANAGGKLRQNAGEPTDEQLMVALAGKMMAIKVMVWKMENDAGEEMTGNWICAVSPAKANAAPSQSVATQSAPAPSQPKDAGGFSDIDVPF